MLAFFAEKNGMKRDESRQAARRAILLIPHGWHGCNEPGNAFIGPAAKMRNQPFDNDSDQDGDYDDRYRGRLDSLSDLF